MKSTPIAGLLLAFCAEAYTDPAVDNNACPDPVVIIQCHTNNKGNPICEEITQEQYEWGMHIQNLQWRW